MLQQYLGINIYMTLIKVGASRRYWGTFTRVSQVADVMSRKTFKQVTKILHFEGEENTNPNSRTRKFQLVLDTLNNVAGGIPMDEHFSIDEQIIAYKGKKSSLRQYNPKKPKEWGFKSFVLSGRSGFIHKIEFYGQPVQELEINGVGKSGQVFCALQKEYQTKWTTNYISTTGSFHQLHR